MTRLPRWTSLAIALSLLAAFCGAAEQGSTAGLPSPLVATAGTLGALRAEPTPVPGLKHGSAILLPLSDGQTVQATVLAADNGKAYLLWVWQGQIVGVTVVPTGTPVPPGPTPPNPPIPPNPPTPVPVVGKLHVLVLWETDDVERLPREQAAIFSSQAVRAYLDSHCVTEKDSLGKPLPRWKFLDKDSDLSKLPADWQAVAARAKGKTLPWLVVANEAGQSYEGPVGKDVAEFLSHLKTLGGP